MSVSLALFVLCAASTSAQAVLRGRARLPDTTAASMALVKVLDADSVNIVRYARANRMGEWSIDKVEPGQYVLQVSFLGLETWARRVTLSEQDTLYFDVALQEQPLTLQLVEISARRIGIVERGDTLQYDLSYYLDSAEYNLKDILNRLPDMSVGDDGSIRFKGKRVHLALVEGRDLFGSLHKAMTEGIAAENVKGIQIIRNYKSGADQEARAISDQVALNVQLTDEARRKLNGDIGLDSDGRRFAEGAATCYQSRPKWGYSLIARGNNTGQLAIFPADLFALVDFENLQPNKGSGSMADIMPAQLTPRPDAQRNLDLLSALNIDASVSPRWHSKLNLRYIKADRRMENVLFRLYIQDNADFTGVRSRRDDANMWQLNLKNDYRGRQRWMKQQLHVFSTRAPEQIALNGSLADLALENRFSRHANQLDLRADVEGGFGSDSLRMLTGRIRYRYSGKSDRIRLQSPDAVFHTQDSLLRQQNNAREAELFGEVSLRRQLGARQITTSAGYSRIAYMLTAETLPDQPDGIWELTAGMLDEGVHGAIALRRPGQKRYNASAQTMLIQRTFPGQPAVKYRYLLTDIRAGFYRDFALLHHLYISGGHKTSPTPFVHLWRYDRIRDESSVYAERVDSSFVQQETFINLAYMRSGQDNGYNLSLTQTASFKKNEVLYQTIPGGNVLWYQSLLAPSVARLSTQGRIAYRLKPLQSNVSANLQHTYQTGYAALSEQLLGVQNNDLHLALSFAYNASKHLEISAGHLYMRSSQRYEGQTPFAFEANRSTTSAAYKRGAWRAHVSASLNWQRIASAPNQFWILGFDAERRFTKPSIRVRLTGRNILNLKGNRMILPDFGANYTGFSAFQTIGGQIMAGLAYVF